MDNEEQITDLYATLGVTKKSTDAEIKKRYHKLAKEFHPDKNPEAGDKFKEISFAYEVLSNPQKRETYDCYGLKGLQEGDYSSNTSGFYAFSHYSGDGERKPKLIHTKVAVTLEELYAGNVTKTIHYKRLEHCPECEGVGGPRDLARKCEKCRGTGRISGVFMGFGAFESLCPNCHGRVYVFSDEIRCLTCEGQGLMEVDNSVDVMLERGVRDTHQFAFPSEGNQNIQGARGDLFVSIEVMAHPTFFRRQDDLYLRDANITLTEALCGFTRCFQHLDGRTICICTQPEEVLYHGAIKKITGKGMPIYGNPTEYGDLIIRFEVKFPENNFASPEQIVLIESVLPPREAFVMPDDPEEVELVEFVQDDDDDNEYPSIKGVQCQTA